MCSSDLELAAASMSVEQIRQRIGADSLHFLSEKGLSRAIALQRTCLACFNGNYLAGHPGEEAEKDALALGDEHLEVTSP